MTRLVCLSLVFFVSACQPSADAPAADAAPVREHVPRVLVPTADGPIDLESLAGRPIVLHFADTADASLAGALADLEAAGATVLVVVASGDGAEAARAFGYDGAPLAVVVDAEGDVRGRATDSTGDGLFALAASVLAEADVAGSVAWQGVDSLDALVAAGGVVVDVSERNAGPRFALDLAADTMAASDLPADLGTPLAFVGDAAAEAAARAVRWGYAAVHTADDEGALTPVVAPERAVRTRRSGGARG